MKYHISIDWHITFSLHFAYKSSLAASARFNTYHIGLAIEYDKDGSRECNRVSLVLVFMQKSHRKKEQHTNYN